MNTISESTFGKRSPQSPSLDDGGDDSGSDENKYDRNGSHRDPDRGQGQQETLGGVRFPVLPERGLQFSVVHDPVHHGRQPGAS